MNHVHTYFIIEDVDHDTKANYNGGEGNILLCVLY